MNISLHYDEASIDQFIYEEKQAVCNNCDYIATSILTNQGNQIEFRFMIGKDDRIVIKNDINNKFPAIYLSKNKALNNKILSNNVIDLKIFKQDI